MANLLGTQQGSNEKQLREQAFKELDKNLSTESLIILAKKSKIKGIDQKLKTYQALIN